MEEEQCEEEDEVQDMKDKGCTPFLTRDTYEKSLSRSIAHEFVVLVEQQAYQQKQQAAGPTILEESKTKASQASIDYANMQIEQPAIIPSPVIKKGEESSPSSYVSLSTQETFLHNCPLNTGASHNSMPKVDMDNLSLGILKPAQLASTQLERSVCQITEEEGA